MIYQSWTFEADQETLATVLPDGCRDILVISKPGLSDVAHYTDWDVGPRRVQLPEGTRIKGYRLCPGIIVPWDRIRTAVNQSDDPASIIAEEAYVEEGTLEAISLLSHPGSSLGFVAAQLGVSERTLQRRLCSRLLPTPDFWRLLGRARAAAQLLSSGMSIAEIATGHGYSDQPHMTREFVRWFGQSPGQLQRSPTTLENVFQPGLGNWTGEQISIR